MTIYSGDEDCGDEITAECDVLIGSLDRCPDCDGRGWVETHICVDARHCEHLGPACPRRETCMGCLGRGLTNGS